MASSGANSNSPSSALFLPFSELDPEDLASNPSQFVATLNQRLTNMYQAIIGSQGATGPVNFNGAHVDMQGARLTNLGPAESADDAVSNSLAQSRYAPVVMRQALEANGSAPLQSYRRLNDNTQRERSSTYLNNLLNTVPIANDSQIVGVGAVSGGYLPVTISAGTVYRTDGSKLNYASFSDSIAVPVSGEYYYYYGIRANTNTLFRASGSPYTADTLANRIDASYDQTTLIAVITVKSSGFDSVRSAAGGTNPNTNTGAGVRLLTRI